LLRARIRRSWLVTFCSDSQSAGFWLRSGLLLGDDSLSKFPTAWDSLSKFPSGWRWFPFPVWIYIRIVFFVINSCCNLSVSVAGCPIVFMISLFFSLIKSWIYCLWSGPCVFGKRNCNLLCNSYCQSSIFSVQSVFCVYCLCSGPYGDKHSVINWYSKFCNLPMQWLCALSIDV
jgi:hypothetical protein